MDDNGRREETTRQVIQLFIETIGFIEPEQVTAQTDFIHDFKIIDDDLACFVMQIEWKFSLGSSQKDWDTITTIEDIVELILRQTSCT